MEVEEFEEMVIITLLPKLLYHVNIRAEPFMAQLFDILAIKA